MATEENTSNLKEEMVRTFGRPDPLVDSVHWPQALRKRGRRTMVQLAILASLAVVHGHGARRTRWQQRMFVRIVDQHDEIAGPRAWSQPGYLRALERHKCLGILVADECVVELLGRS